MKIFHITLIILILSISNLFSQISYENFYKGSAALDYQNYDAALEYFTISIKNEDVDYQNFYFSGIANYKLNNLNDAITNFRSSEKLKSGSATYMLAKCYALSGNIDSALFFLEENLTSTSRVLKSEIFTDEDFRKISTDQKWINFFKNDVFSKVDLLLNDATYALKKENYIEALEIVNQIIDDNKKKHQAYSLKGDIFFKMNNFESASECYEIALNYQENNLIYRQKLAISYLYDKKPKKANEELIKLIEKNPKNLKLFYYRAQALNDLENYTEAISDIELYLKYYVNDNEAKYKYCEILINSEDYLSSIREINKLIDLEPSNSDYYFLRGKSYLNSNSYSLSIDDFSYSLDLNPNNSDIYLLRGQAKQLSGDLDGACNDWNNSVLNGDYKANNYIIKFCNH